MLTQIYSGLVCFLIFPFKFEYPINFDIFLQLRKNLSELAKRSKLLETESVHDNDSMVVNFPNEDDQDEVSFYCIIVKVISCFVHSMVVVLL